MSAGLIYNFIETQDFFEPFCMSSSFLTTSLQKSQAALSASAMAAETHREPTPPFPIWRRKRSRSSPRIHYDAVCTSEPQDDHDAARLLLTLSSPSTSILCSNSAEGEQRKTNRRSAAEEHECDVCLKRFKSGKALGGHMRHHTERDLKGRIVKKKIRRISALGICLSLPTPPTLEMFGKGNEVPPSPLKRGAAWSRNHNTDIKKGKEAPAPVSEKENQSSLLLQC